MNSASNCLISSAVIGVVDLSFNTNVYCVYTNNVEQCCSCV